MPRGSFEHSRVSDLESRQGCPLEYHYDRRNEVTGIDKRGQVSGLDKKRAR